MRGLISKLKMAKYDITREKYQSGNITTNHKLKVDICLPEFRQQKLWLRNGVSMAPFQIGMI